MIFCNNRTLFRSLTVPAFGVILMLVLSTIGFSPVALSEEEKTDKTKREKVTKQDSKDSKDSKKDKKDKKDKNASKKDKKKGKKGKEGGEDDQGDGPLEKIPEKSLNKKKTLEDHVPSDKVKALYAKGLNYMKKKSYKRALSAFADAIYQDSLISGPHVNRGLIFYALEDYASAETEFKWAAQKNKKQKIALLYRGFLEKRKGNFKGAKEYYNKAIEADPKYKIAHYNLGILCDLFLKDIKCALDSYKEYDDLIDGDDDQVKIWIKDMETRYEAILVQQEKEKELRKLAAEEATLTPEQKRKREEKIRKKAERDAERAAKEAKRAEERRLKEQQRATEKREREQQRAKEQELRDAKRAEEKLSKEEKRKQKELEKQKKAFEKDKERIAKEKAKQEARRQKELEKQKKELKKEKERIAKEKAKQEARRQKELEKQKKELKKEKERIAKEKARAKRDAERQAERDRKKREKEAKKWEKLSEEKRKEKLKELKEEIESKE